MNLRKKSNGDLINDFVGLLLGIPHHYTSKEKAYRNEIERRMTKSLPPKQALLKELIEGKANKRGITCEFIPGGH